MAPFACYFSLLFVFFFFFFIIMFLFIFFFFFSSRRRHTRYWRDWSSDVCSSDLAYEHHMTEALWVHQWHNVVDEALLKRMLRSPDYHARAAATRVLCYWRDRVSNPLALLKVQANDDSPRVRLEAGRACSFFKTKNAADVA